MDFFKLIQSLDELLYEIVSWFLFYPITLWRAVTRPVQTMLRVESELHKEEDLQFDDMIGPPLFLFLTLLVLHLVEVGLIGESELIQSQAGLARFITNDANLIVFRVMAFGILPLTAARRLLKARKIALNKEFLRAPFYAQCYPAAVLAVLVSASGFAFRSKFPHHQEGSAALLLAAIGWILVVETRWFKAVLGGSSYVRGFGQTLLMTAQWFVFLLPLVWLLN
jgi:hypothetical protein